MLFGGGTPGARVFGESEVPMASGSPVPLERSLPREAYWDSAFFAREQQAIFLAEWFCAGRSEGLSRPGDYRVIDVAGQSVLLIRGQEALHAHLNLCRHRGSRLLCGEGSIRGALRCPYQGWAYALDGALVASPFVPLESVPEPARRLHPVTVAEWGGFVFLRVGPPGKHSDSSLEAHVGDIAERLARYPLADLRSARSLRYDVAANWKVLLENYNECYHCAGVHPELCRLVPAFKRHGGSGLDWERGIPHREGAFTFTLSGTTTRSLFAGLNDDERTRHKGELLYPNLLLSLCADHVVAFCIQPHAPDRTTVACDVLFHPDEIAKPNFDPSDAVDFWDVVNRQDWSICENVQAGMFSRAFRYGYYAPMEDSSLDIRRYIAERLGADAVYIDGES
jgi:Rieske 2Fe-2S family protein